MTSFRTGYWRVFNVLVRTLGLVALAFGVVFTVLGAGRILQMGLLLKEGAPPVVTLCVGLLLSAIGWALLRAPAVRPDLGDPWWQYDPHGSKSRRVGRSSRSWWTGDRVTDSGSGEV